MSAHDATKHARSLTQLRCEQAKREREAAARKAAADKKAREESRAKAAAEYRARMARGLALGAARRTAASFFLLRIVSETWLMTIMDR